MTTQIFPTPNGTAVGFINQLKYINSLTDVGSNGGILGLFILIVVGGSIFLMMKSFKTESAFVVATLLTSILALYLRTLQLVGDAVLYITIILFIGGILYMLREASNYE